MGAFVTQEEWQSAFDAAQRELLVAIDRGDLDWPNGNGNAVISRIARDIATAVITSSADVMVTGDITDIPGVELEIVQAESLGLGVER